MFALKIPTSMSCLFLVLCGRILKNNGLLKPNKLKCLILYPDGKYWIIGAMF